ncbi:MAG: phosphotransacetylase [Verrucomicrobia bacterium]|nr:phosphotransacetylase [Verrucomicrobiota bacterium]
MRFIAGIYEKLQRHPKRIVFPEGFEPRVIQAARQFYSLRLGVPILLGDRTRIKESAAQLNVPLQGVRIINPVESEELDTFIKRYELLKRVKGVVGTDAMEVVTKPNFFGAMMLAMHQVDGMVSGTNEITTSVLRPLFQIVRVAPLTTTVSSCMILELENERIGERGVIFMADCGVVPEPNLEQLADIAVGTARLARHLLGVRPRVAFLSFSTKNQAENPLIGRIRAAVALAEKKAREKGLEADFDGELQADTALVPEIAAEKYRDSKVAGKANVLIFPDLNSGNIGSRLVQHLAHANAYGHILLGLDRPAADVSRGANAHDILGVAAVVALQAIDYKLLYPGAGELLPGE